ncbi:hypothetical protein OMDBNIEC_00056 [Salmonella phage STP-SP5]|nr:hypothetical protein OMDBNIEC_00056 [Salmonella phage STP-SP5]
MQLENIKEGQELRLTENVGAVGYAHTDETKFLELEEGTVVFVNKVVENLFSQFGKWDHTVIVSVDIDAIDKDGDEVEVNYTAFVGAQYLEPVEGA